MPQRIGPRIERLLDYREYPILFVDDEPENTRIFELTFRREYQVRVARSGEEALQSLHEHPVAVVLSDHRMHGMSGVELLAKVREVDPKTVRILVTAYGDASTLSDAINNGWIYRYLPKPWTPDEMRLTIRNAIEHYALDREREQLLYELDVLNGTSKLFNRELDLVPLLDLLLGTLTNDLGYDGASVFLFDASGERLQLVRSVPRDSAIAAHPADFDVPRSDAPEFIGRLRAGRVQFLRIGDLLSLEAPLRKLGHRDRGRRGARRSARRPRRRDRRARGGQPPRRRGARRVGLHAARRHRGAGRDRDRQRAARRGPAPLARADATRGPARHARHAGRRPRPRDQQSARLDPHLPQPRAGEARATAIASSGATTTSSRSRKSIASTVW